MTHEEKYTHELLIEKRNGRIETIEFFVYRNIPYLILRIRAETEMEPLYSDWCDQLLRPTIDDIKARYGDKLLITERLRS